MTFSSDSDHQQVEYKLLVSGRGTVDVTVFSGSARTNVAGLIDHINDDMADVVRGCHYKRLPYNVREMNDISLSKIDVLLLCPSIENRRFSITDVEDALYEEFLPRCRRYLGKSKIGVIVHDLPDQELTLNKLSDKMTWFRCNQKTTFKNSSVALIGGQLKETPVSIEPDQLSHLRQFFVYAATPTLEENLGVKLYRMFDRVRLCSLCCLSVACCNCFRK